MITLPMKVDCPSCGSVFPVDPRKVPPAGVHAMCSTCSRVFRVEAMESELDGGTFEDPRASVSAGVAEVEAPESDDPGEWDSLRDMVFEPEYQHGEVEAESDARVTIESDAEAHEAEVDSDVGLTIDPAAEAHEAEVDFDMELTIDRGAEAHEAKVEAEAVSHPEVLEVEDGASNDPAFEAAPLPESVDVAEPIVEAPEPLSRPAAETVVSSFGRRDPHERASRLARVLVSDMIHYHQEKYRKSIEAGTLAIDFEDEVARSWEEYAEQVGKEMAEENSYFQDALNEILAQGEQIF